MRQNRDECKLKFEKILLEGEYTAAELTQALIFDVEQKKVIWDAIRDLKSDIREIEKDLPEIYVRKDDFRDAVQEIRTEMREMRQDMKVSFKHIDDTLGAVFKRLENKEDRSK